MRRFLTAFKEYGGQGMEIITGRSNPDEVRRAAHFAAQFELYGSIGSDFPLRLPISPPRQSRLREETIIAVFFAWLDVF
jgi:predicted metal-dependent phosphoesterase TrpH